ncbi:MAG: hypothetical protein Kow0032_29280 [Methyloligellaceae bacterium]
MLTRVVAAGLALAFFAGLVVSGTSPSRAGEADVVDVKVTKSAPGIFRFDVSVRHGDTGWEHYANRWEIVGPDGAVLGRRELAHPHENEQPFTRSLGGVMIPEQVSEVIVRAHDSVHGLGGRQMKVEVPH